MARPLLTSQLRKRFEFPSGSHAIALTDDYNPIDYYDVWLKESVRREILVNID